MAYSELLAMRFRDALGARSGIVEKRMMGGRVFMLDGNMLGAVGRDASGDRFMFRVGPDQIAEALDKGAVQMEMGGRVMKGFIFVREAGAHDTLEDWVAMARRFVETLPAK
ncbi:MULTISPECIES: TfoX/Sxy family protein [Asticcacaulis]|uniref:TfoX/Sxy family protein n=1 Tax=Asticcacaulis TaxID=76890 RepID=UPI001AE62528|nr:MULTISPECIES: TfoX/Sxy family protein [Asticcacaulis]MBP2159485.1 hypothetical protein [Asticcacaulis solisilvae]MDR6800688.1 hypothetical protein [Asticcacaulis sp. BE141]